MPCERIIGALALVLHRNVVVIITLILTMMGMEIAGKRDPWKDLLALLLVADDEILGENRNCMENVTHPDRHRPFISYCYSTASFACVEEGVITWRVEPRNQAGQHDTW